MNESGVSQIISTHYGFLPGAGNDLKAHRHNAQLISNHDAIFFLMDGSHYGSTLLWEEIEDSQQHNTDAMIPALHSTALTSPIPKDPKARPATDTCMVCLNLLPIVAFPPERITPQCNHEPSTCLQCLQKSIKYDHYNKVWDNIRCPEIGCSSLLSYYDVQKYADLETFVHYNFLALQTTASATSVFIWCLKCSSGQYHEGGALKPVVRCQSCNENFCFFHQVAWHEGLTCEEYSRLASKFVASTRNIGSNIFRLLVRKRRPRPETLRLPKLSHVDSKKAILVHKAAEKMAAKMAAKKNRIDEKASLKKIKQTTKPCPGCSWRIEKNDGCDHMRCQSIVNSLPKSSLSKCWY